MAAAFIAAPLPVNDMSTMSARRSKANLSMPVTSCTASGVANWTELKSLRRSTGVPPTSSMFSVVHPSPVALATVLSSLYHCSEILLMLAEFLKPEFWLGMLAPEASRITPPVPGAHHIQLWPFQDAML